MSKTKEMKESQNDYIELNAYKIEEKIKKDKKYEKKGIMIQKWEGEENSKNYITQINQDKTLFIGILNEKFEREGYGYNKFKNGDKYFGYYKEDKRNTHGIYFWNPIKKKDNILKKEIYYGFWKNNKKDKIGCYIWMEEEKGNKDFEKANFDTYIGLFNEEKYKKGTYLSKKKNDYYLYYGEFNDKGKKNDNNAMFYSSSDKLIKGKIENDIFIEGYIGIFDSNSGELIDFMFCNFDENCNINSLKMEKEIDKEISDRIKNEMITFRNVILSKDYFTNIYHKYIEIKEFIKKNMKSLDVLDDPVKYPKIVSLCTGYNKINIFDEIEKKVYNRKP